MSTKTTGKIRQNQTQLFQNRADLENVHDLLEVVDSVSAMTLRAKGILTSLSMQFVDKPEDQSTFWAIDAAMLELEDIRNLIAAHHCAIRVAGGVA